MRRYLAEFLGTFAIVFIGTGAVIVSQQHGGTLSLAGISVTFGLVVMSMIYAFGEISGAHFNPAVSIAFAVAKRFPAKELPAYITVQVTGALAASFLLKMLFPGNATLGATLPTVGDMQTLLLEVILTFFLMLVIFNVACGSKEQGMFAGIAISSVVCMEIMFAGPICGPSLNPARSIGPAIASENLQHLWVYIVGPIIGAVGAVPIFSVLKGKKVE